MEPGLQVSRAGTRLRVGGATYMGGARQGEASRGKKEKQGSSGNLIRDLLRPLGVRTTALPSVGG